MHPPSPAPNPRALRLAPDAEDPAGQATLQALADARRLHRWQFGVVRPWLQAPVLEVGAGLGNISQELVATGQPCYLSDLRPSYLTALEARFASAQNVQGMLRLDLMDPAFAQTYRHVLGQMGTVFSLNVIEHIADDVAALGRMARLLRPGGYVVSLAPAYPALYNRLDAALGHHRRYTRGSLATAHLQAGLHVRRSYYFNAAGLPGWLWAGWKRAEVLPAGPVRLFNALVPAFRMADAVLLGQVGLSAVVVAQKPAG